jgi:transcriptional regulator NrdR family protein
MEYAHEEYLGRPSCPKCGKLCAVPEASAYEEADRIRHRWMCDACESEFETAVRLSVVSAAE